MIKYNLVANRGFNLYQLARKDTSIMSNRVLKMNIRRQRCGWESKEKIYIHFFLGME